MRSHSDSQMIRTPGPCLPRMHSVDICDESCADTRIGLTTFWPPYMSSSIFKHIERPHSTFDASLECVCLVPLCLQENRRDYRDIFITAPNIGNSLSGCILYKETLAQNSRRGPTFVSILQSEGILPGIKVDEVNLCSIRYIGQEVLITS